MRNHPRSQVENIFRRDFGQLNYVCLSTRIFSVSFLFPPSLKGGGVCRGSKYRFPVKILAESRNPGHWKIKIPSPASFMKLQIFPPITHHAKKNFTLQIFDYCFCKVLVDVFWRERWKNVRRRRNLWKLLFFSLKNNLMIPLGCGDFKTISTYETLLHLIAQYNSDL